MYRGKNSQLTGRCDIMKEHRFYILFCLCLTKHDRYTAKVIILLDVHISTVIHLRIQCRKGFHFQRQSGLTVQAPGLIHHNIGRIFTISIKKTIVGIRTSLHQTKSGAQLPISDFILHRNNHTKVSFSFTYLYCF